MFSYDSAAPLNARSEKPEQADASYLTALSYSGALGPVSAALVTPARNGKYPSRPTTGGATSSCPTLLLVRGVAANCVVAYRRAAREAGWVGGTVSIR